MIFACLLTVVATIRLACQRSCAKHRACLYWTWGKGNAKGPCYLKTSRAGVRYRQQGYVSGSKNCWLPERQYHHTTKKHHYYNVPSTKHHYYGKKTTSSTTTVSTTCLEDNTAYFGHNVVMGRGNPQPSREAQSLRLIHNYFSCTTTLTNEQK